MATQQNPIADQLKEQDDREKLAEELRRAERRLLLAKARFDPQAFLTESQSELGGAVDVANQEANRAIFNRAQQAGFPRPVQGVPQTNLSIGAPAQERGALSALTQSVPVQAGIGTASDLVNLITLLLQSKKAFQGGAVTRPGGGLEQLTGQRFSQ